MGVLISSGIIVLMSSMDLATSSKDSFNLYLNEMRSRSCLEEGLIRIKNDPTYTGQASITYTNGLCTVDISNDPSNPVMKIFLVNSTVDTYNYSITKKVDISQEPYLIVE
jgi:hypothetical protein